MQRIAAFLVAVACLWPALISRVQAAACDSIEHTPTLIFVVDTSGSMELRPDCVCPSNASSCTECMPNCYANPSGKSRWSIALEALTGQWPVYQCETYPRTDSNFFTYDLNYISPYHRPWRCASNPAVSCPYPGGQNADGVIDSYGLRLELGLMTFDSMGTWKGGPDQVHDNLTEFSETESQSENGLWSYGPQGSAIENAPRDRGANSVDDRYVGKLMFPGCQSPYRFDTGVRGENAATGALVRPYSDLDPADREKTNIESINGNIQTALLYTRPYGGTPIAAALDDLYYYSKKATEADELGTCRKRYALLITDGIPDDDWRTRSGCGCDSFQECCEVLGGSNCATTTDAAYDPDNFQCPYPKPAEVARALVCGYNPLSCADGVLEQLFVVGFALGGTPPDILNEMASEGSRDGALYREALFADDLETLKTKLGTILNSLAKPPVSRTVSAFAMSSGSQIAQYEFVAGYQANAKGRYTGILERKQTVCKDGVPTPLTLIDEKDRFHVVLNSDTPPERKIWTTLPKTNVTADAYLYKGTAGAPCGSDGCEKVVFSSVKITPEVLGITGTPEEAAATHDLVVNWITGNDREPGEQLSSIRHSSPVVEGPPLLDIADQAYNAFRARPEVANRPLVVYIATNDGVLHAFSAEAYAASATSPHSGAKLVDGEEIWGFVPPYLLSELNGARTSPSPNILDGTAVVKDLFFSRHAKQALSGENYHTVLAVGLTGEGKGEVGTGKGYVALDVTDPLDCAKDPPGDNCGFLWQFTDKDMGIVYGRPALAQVMINWEGTLMERAIAILPGGTTGIVSGACNSARNESGSSVTKSISVLGGSDDISHRSKVRCWKNNTDGTPIGRAVYIIDVATGILLKKIDSTVFPSPVIGTPSVFQGDVGAIATRAFVSDADGFIWRIDLSRPDPMLGRPKEGWTATAFHDMFWYQASEEGYYKGQPSKEPPVLSVDSQGRVVVIHASGHVKETDFDTLDDFHTVVSLTEQGDFSTTVLELDTIRAAVNWELRLAESEMVTGPLELFDKKLLFSSYIKLPDSLNKCDCGKSRLYAVDYLQRDPVSPNGSSPTYKPTPIDLGSPYNLPLASGELRGLQFMGVALSKTPQCVSLSPEPDPNFPDQKRVPVPLTPAASSVNLKVTASGGDMEQGSSLASKTFTVPAPQMTTTIKSYGPSCD
jgi:type IV pilus assembly protein PilY1